MWISSPERYGAMFSISNTYVLAATLVSGPPAVTVLSYTGFA